VRCPSDKPLCQATEKHDGSGLAGAACVALPSACAGSPSCDCLVQDATFDADGGRKTACLFNCSPTDTGYTLLCIQP
jgi:hypothetical protein